MKRVTFALFLCLAVAGYAMPQRDTVITEEEAAEIIDAQNFAAAKLYNKENPSGSKLNDTPKIVEAPKFIRHRTDDVDGTKFFEAPRLIVQLFEATHTSTLTDDDDLKFAEATEVVTSKVGDDYKLAEAQRAIIVSVEDDPRSITSAAHIAEEDPKIVEAAKPDVSMAEDVNKNVETPISVHSTEKRAPERVEAPKSLASMVNGHFIETQKVAGHKVEVLCKFVEALKPAASTVEEALKFLEGSIPATSPGKYIPKFPKFIVPTADGTPKITQVHNYDTSKVVGTPEINEAPKPSITTVDDAPKFVENPMPAVTTVGEASEHVEIPETFTTTVKDDHKLIETPKTILYRHGDAAAFDEVPKLIAHDDGGGFKFTVVPMPTMSTIKDVPTFSVTPKLADQKMSGTTESVRDTNPAVPKVEDLPKFVKSIMSHNPTVDHTPMLLYAPVFTNFFIAPKFDKIPVPVISTTVSVPKFGETTSPAIRTEEDTAKIVKVDFKVSDAPAFPMAEGVPKLMKSSEFVAPTVHGEDQKYVAPTADGVSMFVQDLSISIRKVEETHHLAVPTADDIPKLVHTSNFPNTKVGQVPNNGKVMKPLIPTTDDAHEFVEAPNPAVPTLEDVSKVVEASKSITTTTGNDKKFVPTPKTSIQKSGDTSAFVEVPIHAITTVHEPHKSVETTTPAVLAVDAATKFVVTPISAASTLDDRKSPKFVTPTDHDVHSFAIPKVEENLQLLIGPEVIVPTIDNVSKFVRASNFTIPNAEGTSTVVEGSTVAEVPKDVTPNAADVPKIVQGSNFLIPQFDSTPKFVETTMCHVPNFSILKVEDVPMSVDVPKIPQAPTLTERPLLASLTVQDGHKLISILQMDGVMEESSQYSLRYVSKDGTTVSESGKVVENDGGKGNVLIIKGSYSYNNPKGMRHTINYESDQDGFRVSDTLSQVSA